MQPAFSAPTLTADAASPFTLRVRHMPGTLAYYRDQLGFSVERAGDRAVALRRGEMQIHLLPSDDPRFPPQVLSLHFADVGVEYESAVLRGATIKSPLQAHTLDFSSFTVLDPEGNLLIFLGEKVARPARQDAAGQSTGGKPPKAGRDASRPPSSNAAVRETAQLSAAVLRAYDLLDAGGDSGFDAITSLASYVCGAPMALVSLLDGTRDVIISGHNCKTKEVPLTFSLCAHVASARAPLVLNDAAIDPEWKDHPAVAGGLLVRFYAGVPVYAKHGTALGALCVFDVKARQLTNPQLDALLSLSELTRELLEDRYLRARLKNGRLLGNL